MSWLEIALVAVIVLQSGIQLYLALGQLRQRSIFEAEIRIAIGFIREETEHRAKQFAACYLAGDTDAIHRQFPTYRHYRARVLRECGIVETAA